MPDLVIIKHLIAIHIVVLLVIEATQHSIFTVIYRSYSVMFCWLSCWKCKYHIPSNKSNKYLPFFAH